MKVKKKNQIRRTPDLRAKLSFDEGFAEDPIYVLKARTGEKIKGVSMIQLIKNNFNLNDDFIRWKLRELDREAMMVTRYAKGFKPKPIKWTRDDKGNIISPFRTEKVDFSK